MKAISFLFTASFLSLFSLNARADTDPCSTASDLASKDSSYFVGYGTDSDAQKAEKNAQADLASRIRSRITESTTVSNDNTQTTYESKSQSLVSESLTGVQVIKRCENKSSYSIAIQLKKDIFYTSLEKNIANSIKKAENFKNKIESASSGKSDKALATQIANAKQFLASSSESTEDDLELCQTYERCKDIKIGTVFEDLTNLVEKNAEKDQYVLMTDDSNYSAKLREELVSLLEEENIHIMDTAVSDGVVSTPGKILASCSAKVGTKIPKTEDKVVTVKCEVQAYIGKQLKFRNVYTCSSLKDESTTLDEVVDTCSSARFTKEGKKGS